LTAAAGARSLSEEVSRLVARVCFQQLAPQL
jgi:hypothetical protein